MDKRKTLSLNICIDKVFIMVDFFATHSKVCCLLAFIFSHGYVCFAHTYALVLSDLSVLQQLFSVPLPTCIIRPHLGPGCEAALFHQWQSPYYQGSQG